MQQANSGLQQWHTLQSLYLIFMQFLELVLLLGTYIFLSNKFSNAVSFEPYSEEDSPTLSHKSR